ncbi:MAG: hypothetical protein HY597_04925 [Candidatus Omnitrophica bacterium]|nr:hypothetical protein [Candidatus Omnitrophota bacterium]
MKLWRDAALTAGLTLCSVLLTGYQFGVSDQLLFLPAVNGWLSATGYHSSDLLMSHIWTTHPTVFWFLLAPLFRWLTVPQTLFLLYMASQWAYVAAIFTLARRLFGDATTAVVAVLLLALPKAVGSTWIDTHCVYLVPRTVAVPLALWGFLALLDRRYRLAAVLTALAFDIHPISTLPWVLVMGSALLADRRGLARTERVTAWVLLIGGMLPLLIWRWVIREPGDWFASTAWLEILRRRAPQPFITTWSWSDWSPLLVSGLAWLVARPDMKPSAAEHQVWRVVCVVGGLAVVAVVCTELVFVPLVFQLQLLRAGQYLIMISAIYFSGYLRQLWHQQGLRPWLAVVLFYALFAMWPLLFYGGVAVALFWERAAHRSRGKRWRRADALLMVTAVVAVMEAGFGVSPAGATRTVPVMAALGCLWVLQRLVRLRFQGPRRLVLLAGVAALAVVSLCLDTEVRRVARSPSTALRARIAWPFGATTVDDWTEVQQWARTQTPPGSLFITPPHLDGFRLWSARSPVVEYKDGALGMFSSRVALEWWRRIQDVHGWPRAKSRAHYQTMSESELAGVARTYGAGYVVVEGPKPLSWRSLHENGTYAVYAVPEAAFR